MATIQVWLEDVKEALKKWENEGIEAIEISINDNIDETGKELLINGIDLDGMGIIMAEEAISEISEEDFE